MQAPAGEGSAARSGALRCRGDCIVTTEQHKPEEEADAWTVAFAPSQPNTSAAMSVHKATHTPWYDIVGSLGSGGGAAAAYAASAQVELDNANMEADGGLDGLLSTAIDSAEGDMAWASSGISEMLSAARNEAQGEFVARADIKFVSGVGGRYCNSDSGVPIAVALQRTRCVIANLRQVGELVCYEVASGLPFWWWFWCSS